MSPRVLQLVLSLNPGGTERLVVDLVTRLGGQIPMAVCCLEEEGLWGINLRDQGIPVTELRRASGFRPSLGESIVQVARRHDATIIHCHHYSPFVYGSLARLWKPSLRVVFTEHGRLANATPSPKRRAANLVLSRLPSAVYAVSVDLKRHLVAEGFRPSAVGVIYNGIDVGPSPNGVTRAVIRHSLGLSNETIVVGTIGRLDPVKDFGTLIRAIPLAAGDFPVVLLVVGNGSEYERLTALATECGVANRVHFLGHRDDARDVLAACDIYVNSSISEGVSLTILEAMAAELPIIATNVGGTPEVLDSTCARLVPPKDSSAIGVALLELGRVGTTRRQLGLAARRRVEARFTLDRMVSEYRQVYYGVA
jgi:glycosyltransferase involved in cell wall biosynthesis